MVVPCIKSIIKTTKREPITSYRKKINSPARLNEGACEARRTHFARGYSIRRPSKKKKETRKNMSFGGIVAHFLFLGALAFPIRAPGVLTPVTHFIQSEKSLIPLSTKGRNDLTLIEFLFAWTTYLKNSYLLDPTKFTSPKERLLGSDYPR